MTYLWCGMLNVTKTRRLLANFVSAHLEACEFDINFPIWNQRLFVVSVHLFFLEAV